MTAPALSPECGMAADVGEELHALCRRGEDVPFPDARPGEPPLLKASCGCHCHQPTA